MLVPPIAGAALLGAFVAHALRVSEPLIDLRLFTNRTFAAASGMLVLFAIAVFGAMLLLPLYLQIGARRVGAHAPACCSRRRASARCSTMPIAGQLTDRIGIGRIVLVGMTLILASTLALTQIAADTSYWTPAPSCSCSAWAWARR